MYGDNNVTKIAELWARAVVRPKGINCKDENTIIIVIKPKKERSKTFFQLLTFKKSLFLEKYAIKMRNGIEKTNLEKIVMIKSTSPVSDFIIIWVDTDKKINRIQIKEPNKFEDIISLKNKLSLKKFKLDNNNILIISKYFCNLKEKLNA